MSLVWYVDMSWCIILLVPNGCVILTNTGADIFIFKYLDSYFLNIKFQGMLGALMFGVMGYESAIFQ